MRCWRCPVTGPLLTVLRIIAVDTDPAHVWVTVPAWSPRRALLTGAAPFAEAAGCAPDALAGRRFFAELDLDNPPATQDTGGERLEWPGLRPCPPLPAERLGGAQ